MKTVEDTKLEELANSYLLQKDQRQRTEQTIVKLSSEIEKLNELNRSNDEILDQLLEQAQELSGGMGCSRAEAKAEEQEEIEELLQLSEEEQNSITLPYFEELAVIDTDGSWEDYKENMWDYAERYHIELSGDPFDSLLTESEKNEIGKRIREDYLMTKANCDKYDYIIAAFSGIVCGLMDAFFVGRPHTTKSGMQKYSKLGTWTDKQADKFVSLLSKNLWSKDSEKRNEIIKLYQKKKISLEQRNRMLKDVGIPYNQNLNKKPETLQQCIQYLEKKFKVNYDATNALGLETETQLNGMNPRNHHMMSLAHSPSIIGLIFSILDQFTGKASFVENGKLIRLVPTGSKNEIDRFELRGSNVATKLLCAFVNWLGHLCSDLVGSNTTRASGSNGRGAGIPAPFMTLIQFFDFKNPDGKGEKKCLAEWTKKIFEQGYDARFATTTAIPVLLNEFFIRLMWSLKSRFYHKRDWCDSIPFGNHPELRRMLLVGHGSLCVVDAADAAIRSGGEIMNFMLHLNVVAWTRLGIAGLQEIRAVYRENVVDVNAIDDDLEREWQRIYHEIGQ